jgi:hypothetical protein
MWRNWYTRTPQKRIPQGLGVRLSPCPLNKKSEAPGVSRGPLRCVREVLVSQCPSGRR